MSKALILAEKPSVAKEIAHVLGINSKGGRGSIEGPSHVLTWAVGHLVNICEPEVQNPQWTKPWRLDALPMIPGKFKLSALPKTQDQFEVVKRLMLREDIDQIINATDAGREGELIFRRVYVLIECKKPIQRLWANDMTEEGLKKALNNLLSGESKRNLGLAAFARSEADWLVGMNYSRLLTLKVGQLVTVGRVQTPVLKILVDRKKEIENFTPKDFWTLDAKLEAKLEAKLDAKIESTWHEPPDYKESKIDTESLANEILRRCQNSKAKVLNADKKPGKQAPPLLFDLTTLQREANVRFGFSAKETLDMAQNLYEKAKAITYPRTDSRYLTKELYKEIKKYFQAIKKYPDMADLIGQIKLEAEPECVNDKNVTDHHAIIPTAKSIAPSDLSADENKIYEMIYRRFVAAFMPEASFHTTLVWLDIGGERFKTTGKVFKEKGWLQAEPWRTLEDRPLPPLKKGDLLDVADLALKKKKTKPPAHFTDASLLGIMETVGKLVEDEKLRESLKERGLGTPATRAQIIETLIQRGYAIKDGKKLIASDMGVVSLDMIEALLPEVTSPEMTGEWEKKLKEIENGQFTYQEFMQNIKNNVLKAVLDLKPKSVQLTPTRAFDGKCPRCGKEVLEKDTEFACAGSPPCSFVIKKSLCGGIIDQQVVTQLLQTGACPARENKVKFISKKGKPFSAGLRILNNKVVLEF